MAVSGAAFTPPGKADHQPEVVRGSCVAERKGLHARLVAAGFEVTPPRTVGRQVATLDQAAAQALILRASAIARRTVSQVPSSQVPNAPCQFSNIGNEMGVEQKGVPQLADLMHMIEIEGARVRRHCVTQYEHAGIAADSARRLQDYLTALSKLCAAAEYDACHLMRQPETKIESGQAAVVNMPSNDTCSPISVCSGKCSPLPEEHRDSKSHSASLSWSPSSSGSFMLSCSGSANQIALETPTKLSPPPPTRQVSRPPIRPPAVPTSWPSSRSFSQLPPRPRSPTKSSPPPRGAGTMRVMVSPLVSLGSNARCAHNDSIGAALLGREHCHSCSNDINSRNESEAVATLPEQPLCQLVPVAHRDPKPPPRGGRQPRRRRIGLNSVHELPEFVNSRLLKARARGASIG